jgi:hypothetical protein
LVVACLYRLFGSELILFGGESICRLFIRGVMLL